MGSISVQSAAAILRNAPFPRTGYWSSVYLRLRRDRFAMLHLLVLMAIVAAVILAPLVAPYSPYDYDVSSRLQSVGAPGHLLGTDELGRDILSRLVHGGRVSLAMGILPVVTAVFIGGLLGILAGYFGGRIGMAIMRVMDVFYAFPSVLLAIAISGTLGGGVRNGAIALVLVFIPPVCRVAEAATTQVRSLDYVEAGRASGAGSASIIRSHVLVNVLGPILVYGSSLVSSAIVIASGLSFLGLGVSPPVPDWGLMLSSLRQTIYSNPVVAALPGLAIFITSMCFNAISDGLRSAMNVRA